MQPRDFVVALAFCAVACSDPPPGASTPKGDGGEDARLRDTGNDGTAAGDASMVDVTDRSDADAGSGAGTCELDDGGFATCDNGGLFVCCNIPPNTDRVLCVLNSRFDGLCQPPGTP
jgi:hypothetical protein